MRFGWLHTPPCVSTYGTSSPRNSWKNEKFWAANLNDLERDTEAVYRARIIKKQDDKARANSKEAAAQELPPER